MNAPPRYRLLVSIVALTLCALLLAACGGDSEDEPSPTPTASALAEGPTEASTSVPTEMPTARPTASATVEATATVQATEPAGPPNAGAWIDVDVTKLTVSLMNGVSVIRTISPIAVGREIDTGVYESTATGLFSVYEMDASLTYDEPYDTYISHWVGFDPALDNGFHSFLKDEDGNVVDASTGRVSNGCIRTGAAEAIYEFAEIGMPVYVHY